jgi:hypothetical protein
MEHLTSLSEMFETMVADGKMTDGQYLTAMNALGKLNTHLPPPPPPPQPPMSEDAIYAAVEGYCYTTARGEYYDGLIASLRRFANGTADAARVAEHFTLGHGVGQRWMDERHRIRSYAGGLGLFELREKVLAIPAVRRCAIEVALREKQYMAKLLHILRNGLTEAALSEICYRLSLPFHPAAKWDNRSCKPVAADVSKRHRVSVKLGITSGERDTLPVELYTPLIQMGRTACAGAMSMLAAAIGLSTGRTEWLGSLLRRNMNSWWGSPCPVLSTSGITGRTKDKQRTYCDANDSLFSITYIGKLNTGEASA